MTSERADRDRIEQIAIEYIGTPFHDHGEVKGAGVDCATLLKCIMTEAGVLKPFKLDHYSPQFFLHQAEERYLGWIKRCGGIEIEQDKAKPGDIVIYKIGLCYAHAALIVQPGWPAIIHAHYGSGCVRRDTGTRPRIGRVLGTKFFSLFATATRAAD